MWSLYLLYFLIQVVGRTVDILICFWCSYYAFLALKITFDHGPGMKHYFPYLLCIPVY